MKKRWKIVIDEQNFIGALLEGNQLRVRYKNKNEDCCDPPGWWIEELWKYNKKRKLIECYYPVSSYDLGVRTAYDLKTAEYQIRDILRDYNEGNATIKLEKHEELQDDEKTIKEIAIEKIMSMDDAEIIARLFWIK